MLGDKLSTLKHSSSSQPDPGFPFVLCPSHRFVRCFLWLNFLWACSVHFRSFEFILILLLLPLFLPPLILLISCSFFDMFFPFWVSCVVPSLLSLHFRSFEYIPILLLLLLLPSFILLISCSLFEVFLPCPFIFGLLLLFRHYCWFYFYRLLFSQSPAASSTCVCVSLLQ